LGVIAFETSTDDLVHPGMLINENLIVEIVVPGTGTPVNPGDVGEIVVTRLHPDYPLLRFATGDLSAQIVEPSPCGRTAMRIKGWMGRADQRAKVRGMFVDPKQLAALALEHEAIERWRLVISRDGNRDIMQLRVSVQKSAPNTSDASDVLQPWQAMHKDHAAWLESIAQTLKKATNLNGQVKLVDSLPNDGVIIEDQRDYD
jgi:phenylacetate-CoA ligase